MLETQVSESNEDGSNKNDFMRQLASEWKTSPRWQDI